MRKAKRIVQTLGKRGFAALALGLLIASGTGTAVRAADDPKDPNDTIVFTIDVAEDFTQFSPTFVKPEHTQPERGSFFVTEGSIFPGGTIQGDGATFNPNGAGAIGKWFCRGTHLVSATEFLTAAIGVHTSQLYLLPNQNKSLSTDGVEGVAPARRPVTGGTGMFRDYVGEMKQELLGFNATGGVNLRVTFVLKNAVREAASRTPASAQESRLFRNRRDSCAVIVIRPERVPGATQAPHSPRGEWDRFR